MREPSRRDLLKFAAAGALIPRIALASQSEPQHLVPEDKGLPADWLQQITARGEKDVYSGADLAHIGMPVGGCFSGMVYLSGDGRLWNWDIFNVNHVGCVARPPVVFEGETLHEPEGANYVDPPKPASPFKIEFSLRSAVETTSMDSKGWKEVVFKGEYPIGTVRYSSDGPFEVVLEAFSPFIPLDVESSSFPATVMSFTVKNKGERPESFDLACEFEHPAFPKDPKPPEAAKVTIADRSSGEWRGAFADLAAPYKTMIRGDAGTFSVLALGGEVTVFETPRPSARVWKTVSLKPGESRTVPFIVAWHFPNTQIPGLEGQKRWYSTKWENAFEVAAAIAGDYEKLAGTTRLWRDTWYDSTLPYWLLDRTFANLCILATTTCYRFQDGRFWFWEGTGCCAGTCTHVWSYAQGIGRVFPEVERYLREEIDYGRFFHEETGAIQYRGEYGDMVATDGQCGCILRAYREHLMSRDSEYLTRLYPRIKKSLQYLIGQDSKNEGLLEGAQYNTLDAAWYGPMGWISSLYIAALRAGEAMANEMKDAEFASKCRSLAEAGAKHMVERLFDGEYFIHIPDPAHPECNATGKGCHIDQLYGQSWAHQVGLPRVVPEAQGVSAMRALYKYNFAPDVGVYRHTMKIVEGGRWYAVPGEAGLIMTTFPKGGAERATGAGRDKWAAMYFNECMTGFEHQAAANMVSEGLALEGLTVTHAIHQRYSGHKRNPYNEVECSDHYGRAMASYGVYVAACGFKCHGPKKEMSFDPKIQADDFRAAFIAPDGWGTYTQKRGSDGELRKTVEYKWRAK